MTRKIALYLLVTIVCLAGSTACSKARPNVRPAGTSNSVSTVIDRSFVENIVNPGRSGHLQYRYTNWTEAESALNKRGFHPLDTCHSTHKIQPVSPTHVTNSELEFTWNCQSAHVSYCHANKGGKGITCNQVQLDKGQSFNGTFEERGNNPLQVYMSHLPATVDGIWNFTLETQCELGAGQKGLVCPNYEGATEILACPGNNIEPQNRKLTSGLLEYEDHDYWGYEEFEVSGNSSRTMIKVRPAAAIIDRLKALQGQQVDIFLETLSTTPSSTDRGVNQEGRLLMIGSGDAFGIQDTQVEVEEITSCTDSLRSFHGKNARLVIRPVKPQS
jgi:hypothetical protein